MSKTKRHGSLIEKNRLLIRRDLELSFNSTAFSSVYKNCFPIKKGTTKKTVITKPWLTKGLLTLLRKRMLYISGFYPCQLSVINASISVLEISLPGIFSMKLLIDVNVT